jgi:undecaprenyl-diphosphatase
MQLLNALIAGLIQGLTEFLPVSSSGHLVLFHEVFGFEFGDNVFFDVAMHAATLAALVLFFRREVVVLVRGFFRLFKRPDLKCDLEARLALLVMAGSVPVVLVGALVYPLLGSGVRSVPVVITTLSVVALVFFVAERFGRRERMMPMMTAGDALLIGAAQSVALVPGVSRSGITICAGMARRLKRDEAARFSFLISIPAVAAAVVKSSLEVESWAAVDWPVLGLGFLAALLSGLFAIRFLLRFVGRHPLHVFAWYRLALAAAALAWLALR